MARYGVLGAVRRGMAVRVRQGELGSVVVRPVSVRLGPAWQSRQVALRYGKSRQDVAWCGKVWFYEFTVATAGRELLVLSSFL